MHNWTSILYYMDFHTPISYLLIFSVQKGVDLTTIIQLITCTRIHKTLSVHIPEYIRPK